MKEFWDNSLCSEQRSDAEIMVDVKKVFSKLCKSWKRLLLWAFVGGVIGSLYAIGVPRQYTVVSKIAPELSLRTTSLTALASLTGANMLSGNNDAVLPSVYPDIVNSSTFLADLLDESVNDSTLYYYIQEEMPVFWLRKVMAFPFRLVGLVAGKDAVEESQVIDSYRLSKKQYSSCLFLKKNINVTVDKKNFLVTVAVTMPDKEVAAQVSRYVIENLKAYVSKYRTEKAVANAAYLEKIASEAHSDYLLALRECAEYLDSNQGVRMRSNQIKGQDYQNKVNLKFQLYSSLQSELQNARIKVKQDTPVFSEVVPPTVPVRSSNSRKSIALVFVVIAVLACSIKILSNKES